MVTEKINTCYKQEESLYLLELLALFIQNTSLIKRYIFVCKKSDNAREWIKTQLAKKKIKNYDIIELTHQTRGQAETVALALTQLSGQIDVPFLVINIDTIIHQPEISQLRSMLNHTSGVIDVANLEGTHWSFVMPNQDLKGHVKSFVEKLRISDLASTGLYGFSSSDLYLETYYEVTKLEDIYFLNGELYISAIYQRMLEKGLTLMYRANLGEISLAGTPDEYINYCFDNDWKPEAPET